LTVAESAGTMTGIPLAELNIQGSNHAQPIVFVGVGVKRKNSDQITLVSDQITPIKGTGAKKLELAGISIQLNKGDIIGLVIKSYSDQYRFSGSGWLTQSKVSGKVALPIQADNSVMPSSSSFASRQMLMDRAINNE
jgi:ABC-2 type transport system ATP-binding protein